MKLLGVLLFFAWSIASAAYVNSLEEFRLHISLHRFRVHALGMFLYSKAPERFKDVEQGLLKEFLVLHDATKLEESILRRLYQFYGKSFPTLSQIQKIEFLQLQSEFDRKNKYLIYSFFDEHKIHPTAISKYLLIEKVSDAVDRGLCKAAKEEFGRSLLMASEFFEFTDPELAKLAMMMEENYNDIVGGLEYVPICVGHLKYIAASHHE